MNIFAGKKLFWGAIVAGASALAIVAIVLDGDLNRLSTESHPIQSEREEAKQSQENSSLDAGLQESASETIVAPERPVDDRGNPTVPEVDEETGRKLAEEEATIRERATRDIKSTYSLLFEDLELTAREKDALFALLIEDRIASTWSDYKRGETIDKQEQSRRIAAIIAKAAFGCRASIR